MSMQIAIVLEGGCIIDVYGKQPFECQIFDYDNLEDAEDGGMTRDEATRNVTGKLAQYPHVGKLTEEPAYRNHYTCPRCNCEWTDEYDCCPDDDCPKCGERHISPHTSDPIQEN